ncbi:RICIN domain-containing protein [Streptomyces sp. BE230]|uniref:RICIN domain-containing protein n=1 Tax=Streptomyces sp. BE230 TaxID=3002526 RepID=UPI002ED6BC99|nr:helix-turn-helix domain-containing protein [Streptomyces sp. BE230]
MDTTGGVEPERAVSVTHFVDMMKRLKDASGLTYRQLEERAEKEGRVLPRSTIADVLRRQALPRPHMLNAFVHACGAGEHADAWLRARTHLALAGDSATGPGEADSTHGHPAAPSSAPARDRDGADDASGLSGAGVGVGAARRTGVEGTSGDPVSRSGDPGGAPKRSRRRHRASTVVWIALSAAVVTGIGAWLLLSDRHSDSDGAPSSEGPEAGWYSIQPARATDLCVTEGQEPGGDTVAMQRPCLRSTPPYTRIEPLGDGRFFVKWAHPVHGWGCLTVVTGGLLEPWDDCRSSRATQVFRFERVGTAGPAASGRGRAEPYRIRSASGGQCLGIAGTDPKATSTVAVTGPCVDGPAQHFLLAPEAAPAASALPSASG